MTKEQTRSVEYAVIGSRPIRHDGLDKVTGNARYGADLQLPGMLPRQGASESPCPRAYPLHRYLEGRGAARRLCGGDLRGLSDHRRAGA